MKYIQKQFIPRDGDQRFAFYLAHGLNNTESYFLAYAKELKNLACKKKSNLIVIKFSIEIYRQKDNLTKNQLRALKVDNRIIAVHQKGFVDFYNNILTYSKEMDEDLFSNLVRDLIELLEIFGTRKDRINRLYGILKNANKDG